MEYTRYIVKTATCITFDKQVEQLELDSRSISASSDGDNMIVAPHMHYNEHNSDINNLIFLEPVSDTRKLDFLETSFINSADPDLLLTREGGPCNSVLLKYV